MEKVEDNPPVAAKPRRFRRAIAWLSWIYAICVLAVWFFLRIEGDQSWLGLFAIFSPRWVILTPLILLVPLAAVMNRRYVWVLAVVGIGTVFEILGLCLPWRAAIHSTNSGQVIRVLTCNVHHHAVDADQLGQLIAAEHPDIVVLQEYEPPYEAPIFRDAKWNFTDAPEWFLASRFPIDSYHIFENHSGVHYVLEASAGKMDFYNVHFTSPHIPFLNTLHGIPSGKDDLEKNILAREGEARDMNRMVEQLTNPFVIAGDFNLCPDSPIFRKNFGNFTDGFETAGFGFGWSYRVKWTAARIDHILVSDQWTFRRCWLGPDIGSPHRPLIADISMPNAHQ